MAGREEIHRSLLLSDHARRLTDITRKYESDYSRLSPTGLRRLNVVEQVIPGGA
jgi:hypothetical protein